LHGTAVTAFTGYDIPAMCFSIAGLAIAAAVSLYYLMSIPAMPLFGMNIEAIV
jgi:hypothetical protein